MLKEIKYFIFFLFIIFFIFFSIKYYISDENKKKTFRSLSSIENKIDIYELNLPVIFNDTQDIIRYLNLDDNTNKKKFWD